MNSLVKTATLGTSKAIANLNDSFRQSFIGGAVMLTAGIIALGREHQQAILEKVRAFEAFTPDNDPHGEHDFGSFDHAGETIMFKIDYYDQQLLYHSPDPADPSLTRRMLTIMLATDY